ncbi:HNH endonuclease, partial [Azospirillum sp. Vi22]|uniref:HNH endonuclease n=1 Tax=Azospirillum baldaniorum TaxID=1064539 RepID=UPI00157B09D6|nr:HNH endonuclease [Azospirillum baldaniorum]
MALSPLDRIRLDKAAVDEGFGLRRPSEKAAGAAGDWLAYGSLGAPAALLLTRAAEGYVVAVDHPGVAADLAERWPSWPGAAPAGYVAFMVTDTAPLHDLVREIWRLARTLPTAPLRAFEERTASLPRRTEAERLTIQRIGQDLFRAALMDYWSGACAVTGLSDARLLRASHIRPWAACDSDAERLDVHNGLLLAVHLDAAFDAGLIAFTDDGTLLASPAFTPADRAILDIHD